MVETFSKQKERAIGYMSQLGICKPYIRAFKAKAQKVCFFEGFAGFYDFQEPEIEAKRKEIEKEYGDTVFAITHEFVNGDEMYSFLLASEDEEDISIGVEGTFECFAYIWNKTDPMLSELGYVGIKSFGGGIKRIY